MTLADVRIGVTLIPKYDKIVITEIAQTTMVMMLRNSWLSDEIR